MPDDRRPGVAQLVPAGSFIVVDQEEIVLEGGEERGDWEPPQPGEGPARGCGAQLGRAEVGPAAAAATARPRASTCLGIRREG